MSTSADRNQNKDNVKKPSLKPDAATRTSKDPQKNMEGPMSSSTRKTGDIFDTDETKRQADQKKDKNI